MFDKVFKGLVKNFNASNIMTKKISRREFLKGTGLMFAILSLGNVTNAFNKPKVKVVTKEIIKTSGGGYGNSGYGA